MYFASGLARVVGLRDVDLDPTERNFSLEDDITFLSPSPSGPTHCAALSSRAIYILSSKPPVIVCKFYRNRDDIEEFGENYKTFWRFDGEFLAVITKKGFLILYQVSFINEPVFVSQCSHAVKCYYGPNELAGIRTFSMTHDACITQVEDDPSSLLSCGCFYKNFIVLGSSGKSPGIHMAVIQQNEIFLVSNLFEDTPGLSTHIEGREIISINSWDDEKLLCILVDSLGQVHLLKFNIIIAENKLPTISWRVWTLATKNFVQLVALNSRLSLLALGHPDGTHSIYRLDRLVLSQLNHDDITSTFGATEWALFVCHIQTFSGYSKHGSMSCLRWSLDGHCLTVGYKTWGFVLFSTFGNLILQATPNALQGSTLDNEVKLQEPYIHGVQDAFWGPESFELFILPSREALTNFELNFPTSTTNEVVNFRLINLYIISVLKSVSATLQTVANLRHAVLLGSEILVIISTSTIEKPDIPMEIKYVRLPSSYLASSWPIKIAVVSECGKYIFLAGVRGFVIYCCVVGKFSVFGSQAQEQSFECRLAFFDGENINFVSKKSENDIKIIVLRITPKLDLQAAISTLDLQENPLMITRLEDTGEIIVLLVSGNLYYLNRGTLSLETNLCLTLIGKLPPEILAVKVLCISRFQTVKSKFVFLFDGMSASFNFLTNDLVKLDEKTENLISISPLYDLANETVWLVGNGGFLILSEGKKCIEFPLDFVPLALIITQGVLIGLSPQISSRRNFGALNYSFSPKTCLYLHHVFEHLLETKGVKEAYEFGKKYSHLGYYNHALEMLLHQVWEREAELTKNVKKNALLPVVITFIRKHNQYLDIVVNCARKTELCMWEYLFSIIGSPREFFYECLSHNRLDAAAAFLVILHNMESQSLSGSDSVNLLQKLLESENFDTCRDLIRFISNVDRKEMGQKLWDSLQRRKTASPSPQNSPQSNRSKSSELDNKENQIENNSNLASISINSKIRPIQENVEEIISKHAINLLKSNRLRCLLQMARTIDFPLDKWLSKERNRAAVVGDYIDAIKQVHQQFHIPYPTVKSLEFSPEGIKGGFNSKDRMINSTIEQFPASQVDKKETNEENSQIILSNDSNGDHHQKTAAIISNGDHHQKAAAMIIRRHSFASFSKNFATIMTDQLENSVDLSMNNSEIDNKKLNSTCVNSNFFMRDRRTVSLIEHGFMELIHRKDSLQSDLLHLAKITRISGCYGWHILISAVLGDVSQIVSAVIEHSAQKEWNDIRIALDSLSNEGYFKLINSVTLQITNKNSIKNLKI